MADETLGDVIRRIGRSAGLQSDLALTDAELLERFVKRRDEPAFAALLARHGQMVLGVCRRLVRDAQEAEDAFQAVFLVLARKAAGIQRQPLLAGWLYGVAYRVAVRLRGQTARRRAREQRDVDLSTLAGEEDAVWSDVHPLVDEEVQRLPDKYRGPIVLCYLEGKTNEQAAQQLRWPVGSVKSRLNRARELLRSRLTRRGLALSASLLTTALAVRPAPASHALADATIRGAALFARGGAGAGGLASARAVTLSQGMLRTMILTKVKIAAALALTVAMLGGVAGFVYQALAAEPGPASRAAADADKPAPADKPGDDREAIQGTWLVVSAESEGKEAPPETIKDLTILVTADKIVFQPKGEARQATYKLDPTKTPKELELTPLDGPAKGKALKNIYQLDGDALKLCVQNGAGEPPTEFATKPGSGLRLLVLKRQAAEKDKPADKPKDDKEALQGVWRVVGMETEGVKRDDDQARQVKTEKWAFTADKIKIVAKIDFPGAPREEEFTYKLDTDKTPKTIDMTHQSGLDDVKGQTKKAVYSLEGDILKICHSLSAPEIKQWDQLLGRRQREFEVADLFAPGRPTEVATKEGSRTTLLILKRESPEKDNLKDDKPKPSSADVPAPPGKGGEKEQKLLQDWRDRAKEAFRLHNVQFLAGKTTELSVLDALQRLLDAELEGSTTQADRVAVYEAHVRRVMDVMKAVNAQVTAGQLTAAEAADGEAFLLKAEFLLEREKAK